MRRFFLLSASAILVASCGHSSRLTGTWKGKFVDVDPHEQGKVIADLVHSMLGELTLELGKDGKYKEIVGVGSITGTYTVSGNTVTLSPDDGKALASLSKWTLDGNRLGAQVAGMTDFSTIVLTKVSSNEP